MTEPDYFDDFCEPELDEFEEAMGNCHGFFEDGHFVCMAVGSEDCEWDCPFNRDLGMTAEEIEERDMAELEASRAREVKP